MRVTVKDVLFVLAVWNDDEDTILLEEVTPVHLFALFEFTLIWTGLVDEHILLGTLVVATKDSDLTVVDLQSSKVEVGGWQLQIQQLPIVLSL